MDEINEIYSREATFRKLKREWLKVALIGQYQFISDEAWFEFVRERETKGGK